jgi:hypothetical protein
MRSRTVCSRHAEPGAGAPDIFDELADYLVASSFIEALEQDCVLCHGRGTMIGADEEVTCPRCHGTGTE